jgi:hypothetical protein
MRIKGLRYEYRLQSGTLHGPMSAVPVKNSQLKVTSYYRPSYKEQKNFFSPAERQTASEEVCFREPAHAYSTTHKLNTNCIITERFLRLSRKLVVDNVPNYVGTQKCVCVCKTWRN